MKFSAYYGIPVKITTWNVKGLRSPSKRSQILRHLKKLKVDIAMLQEIHLDSQDFFRMKKFWVGSVVGAPANGRSAGVLTLISKTLLHSVLHHDCDHQSGRWSHLTLQLGSSTDLWNIYGPNNDNRCFFTELQTIISSQSSSPKMVVVGDFNAVPSPRQDRRGSTLSTAGTKNSHDSHLDSLLQNTHLIDIWCFFQPLDRDFFPTVINLSRALT